jgi:hypothetical protein
MAQGDVPTSPGGLLRRRREKRQLEQLAEEAARRKSNPSSAQAHVSVIEDQITCNDQVAETQVSDTASEPMVDSRPRGFHVRPVPIDEPIDKLP